jgi:hypothetical protein
MLNALKYNPVPTLLKNDDKAFKTFFLRDLLGEKVSIKELWQLKEAKKILKKQKLNGSWEYPSKKVYGKKENYNQYETFRKLGILIEKFGFNKTHPTIQKSANYFFSAQTPEGDFRGIYDNQYTPNYSAGIMELLIKAGYEKDKRIINSFKWLISIRQEDGGWALPFRTQKYNLGVIHSHPTTIKPDKSKPYSHMVTGVVLRAFAAHPKYKKIKEANHAGKLLLANLFKSDKYPDRRGKEYWLRFAFPFCYTDLISAMDSLSLLGFSKREHQMAKALKFFIDNQQKNGLWQFKIVSGSNRDILQLWLSLAVCRIFKRLYGVVDNIS